MGIVDDRLLVGAGLPDMEGVDVDEDTCLVLVEGILAELVDLTEDAVLCVGFEDLQIVLSPKLKKKEYLYGKPTGSAIPCHILFTTLI